MPASAITLRVLINVNDFKQTNHIVNIQCYRRTTKRPPKVVPLNSKKRLSSFRGLNLPDIDIDPTSCDSPSSIKGDLNQNKPARVSPRNTGNKKKAEATLTGDDDVGSSPKFETWITMGPDGEIKERRWLEPIQKSRSDTALNEKCKDSEKLSKLDIILSKTKNIFNSDKLKKPVDEFASKVDDEAKSGSSRTKSTGNGARTKSMGSNLSSVASQTKATSLHDNAKASWSPDQEEGKEDPTSTGRFSSAFKTPLKGLQEKLRVKLSEKIAVLAPDTTQEEEDASRQNAASSTLKFFNDVRSRFSTSPKQPKKKLTVYLSLEEIERRARCKTQIIDL